MLLLIRLDLQYKTSKNREDHVQKPLRNSSLKCRRGIVAQIKSVPNISGDVVIVGKSNSPRIITRNPHGVRLPTIWSASVEIDIAYLISTWSRYLKWIGGTPFKCSCRWIIQPWCIDLNNKLKGQTHKSNYLELFKNFLLRATVFHQKYVKSSIHTR